MILALITRLSPLARWAIAIAAGLALIGGLILWLGAREQADDKSNQAVGAAVQREADQAVTIERTEKANAAAETVRVDPVARDAECLRHARNPKDC
jgi:hypothetical protein